MVVDPRSPVRPVSFLARSQSHSLHVSSAHILPSCLRSPSLPFYRYLFRHHSPQYVPFFPPHHVTIPFQSSLRYRFRCLRYFCRSSNVFAPDLVLPGHPPHIHLSIRISLTSILASCRLVVAHVSAIMVVYSATSKVTKDHISFYKTPYCRYTVVHRKRCNLWVCTRYTLSSIIVFALALQLCTHNIVSIIMANMAMHVRFVYNSYIPYVSNVTSSHCQQAIISVDGNMGG